MPLPTVEDVTATAHLLADHVVRTPLAEFPALNAAVGRQVLLKIETFQRTNSFKFRGAMSRLLRLDARERAAGVVAWSSGNHGQAVAMAGRLLGIATTIVMPADAPGVKLARTRAAGATVITYDRARESREAISFALAREQGLIVVPSFDDRWVMAGQGSVGMEILAQCAELGVEPGDLLIPCSGGGLTAGCALAMDTAPKPPRIWTVEPEGFDDHARSWHSGQREHIRTDASSLCDALLAPTPGELTFAINRPRVAGGLAVSDADVRRAMRFAFDELRLVVEPGGAAALAALLAGRHAGDGSVTVAIISGGNVDPGLFASILADRADSIAQ
ncbi:MAG: threonine/serine dehydratase [Gammaproteobacteria bacterium]|nr:threonine/serine dehydratase [Gammaproteobacteria bacterium]